MLNFSFSKILVFFRIPTFAIITRVFCLSQNHRPPRTVPVQGVWIRGQPAPQPPRCQEDRNTDPQRLTHPAAHEVATLFFSPSFLSSKRLLWHGKDSRGFTANRFVLRKISQKLNQMAQKSEIFQGKHFEDCAANCNVFVPATVKSICLKIFDCCSSR